MSHIALDLLKIIDKVTMIMMEILSTSNFDATGMYLIIPLPHFGKDKE